MNYKLLSTDTIAIGLLIYSAIWWATFDSDKFKAEPANDTFKNLFHKQRTLWRAGFAALVIGLASAVASSWPQARLNIAGLIIFYVGYWLRTFNPQLNVKRELAYVSRFYISLDPTAAFFPDRWIANMARKRYPDDHLGPRLVAQQMWANERFQLLLNIVLFVGIVVGGYFLVRAFLV